MTLCICNNARTRYVPSLDTRKHMVPSSPGFPGVIMVTQSVVWWPRSRSSCHRLLSYIVERVVSKTASWDMAREP